MNIHPFICILENNLKNNIRLWLFSFVPSSHYFSICLLKSAIIIIIIIIIIISSSSSSSSSCRIWKFLTPAIADRILLEFEWQLVSSSLQDSSQYSDWSK